MKRRRQARSASASPASGEPPPRDFVNAAWQGNEIALLRRDVSGKLGRIVVPAEHVCYLRADAISEEIERTLRGSRHIIAIRREGDWLRVRWKSRDACRSACGPDGWFEQAEIVPYEADVNPIRRYLTDNDVQIQRPRRCFVDLETDSRVPPRKAAQGLARVLVWSLIGDDGREAVGILDEDEDEDEAELLEALWKELRDFDQILSWNGDRFDFPIITLRSDMHGLRVDPRRWLWLDHLEAYRVFNISASESGDEKQSMALQAVAVALGLPGKLDVDASRSYEEWLEDADHLADYCLHDSRLMVQIEERTGYVELLYTLADACGVFPDSRAINSTNFVEGFLLRLGLKRGVHFRSHWGIQVGEKFAGAYVMEPTKKGILRNVHVADFSSLYPSIIQSWNISPETYRDDVVLREDPIWRPSYLLHAPLKEFPRPDGVCEVPILGHVFDVEPVGVLPEALDTMRTLRAEWNEKKKHLAPGTDEWKEADRRSSAYKIGANSFYGVTGSPFSRFFKREVAESVTQAGVWLIKKTIEAAEERGFKAVYGDTDSIFVTDCSETQFAEFVAWCNRELYPKLLDELGCRRNEIDLAYEKAFDVLVLVGKKRYAGRWVHYKGSRATKDSRPEIKGLEFKRGDTARLARRMQAKAIELLLGDYTEDRETFVELVRLWRWYVLEGPLEQADIILSKRLSKELRTYRRKKKKDGSMSALPPHVEVATVLRDRGEDIGEGTRIAYFVVDGGVQPSVCAPAVDYKPGDEDRYYLWENLVFPPTLRLLEAAFPMYSWKSFVKARPPKPRKTSASSKKSRKRKVPPGQGSLFG